MVVERIRLVPITRKQATKVRGRPNLSKKKDIQTTPTISNRESSKLSIRSRPGSPLPRKRLMALRFDENIIITQPIVDGR